MKNRMQISVFYSRSSLHHLITKVIRPFIELEKQQNNIENWFVALRNVQGDHIDLSIQSANSGQLQKKFLEVTSQFLVCNPSSENAVKYPLTGLFMNYPNNSIQISNRRLFPSADLHEK